MTTKKKIAKKAIKKKIAKVAIKKTIQKGKGKEKKLGKVTHYFDKVKVVAIKLVDNLSIGDTIRIVGGENTDFKQKVVSMEFKGEKLKEAKKGKEVGVKVKNRAREGYKVFRM
ncbi:MAG: translation elongation factor-like protein [Candidatus Paceibacterota bacterium]|jgi:putative protease